MKGMKGLEVYWVGWDVGKGRP